MPITEELLKNYIINNIEGRKPTKDTLQKFRKKNKANNLDYISHQFIKSLLEDTIIFISDRPNFFFLRMSKALMNAGYNTILLTRWGVSSGHRIYFNDVLLFDSLLDLYKLNEADNVYIYVQSWIGWFFLPVFVKLITKSPVFCNVNDSSMLLFDDVNSFQRLGIDVDNALFDIECEKYIYNNFDLVTHPYASDILSKKILYGRNMVLFPCYCLNDFSYNNRLNSNNQEYSLIFIGGIPYDNKDDDVFKDAKIQGVVEQILNLNINLTILNNPLLTQSNDEYRELYPFFYNLSCTNKNFTFISGYPPWSLYEYTEKAMYGIMIYDFSDVLVSKNHINSIIPTKFFTYLELGLPVIVIDEMEFVANLVRKNNLGIVVSYSQIKDLGLIIDDNQSQYNSYIVSIRNYKESNNMDNKISELLSFLS